MRHLIDWVKLNALDILILAFLLGIFWLSFPAR